ncbi:MAG: OmpA family protein [Methylotenera sp.]|uniref:OmpA family protein n=1 Tax=Methylotenera sp. TaxID=2051956 RepID=UPI00248A6E43|nr:OmpA family protein [Methylotenera sp.]MDI1307929.1 OmpA family protein [Methylotenera sp.]
MNNRLIQIAVVATLGLTALSASAEDMYRGAWYALPGISYMDTDNDLNAGNGGGAFIKFGKEVSPSWDIQGGLGYNTSNENGIAGASGRYKQTTLGLDALYMLSRDKFRPFVLVGGGVARNKLRYSIPAPNNDLSDSKTGWMANVGFGAQYLVSDTFGMQADLRQQWSRAKGGLDDNLDGTNVSNTETISNTLLSLGGIFRFGAPTPMPVVAEAEPVAAPYVAPEPVQEPAPAPVPVAEPCKPKFETVTISAEKLFGFDKSKLQEGSKPILDEVVTKLKEHSEFKLVMVTGYTDRIGSEAYNQKLSEKRANQVKAYIVSQGIDASRLQAIGKGESEPVAECKGVKGKKLIECLAPNRRVVILDEEQRKVEGQAACN